jgi:hypothetical protein
MPTPSRRKLRFNGARQEISQDGNKTLVQEKRAELNFSKITKELTSFTSRVNSSKRITGAVGILT